MDARASHHRRAFHIAMLAVGAALLGHAETLVAAPTDGIRQLPQTSWASEVGARSGVADIGETGDGCLWSSGRIWFRSSSDGARADTGAAVPLAIEPAFYRTWWFLLLCLVPAVALARRVYTMRLRKVARRVRQQMEVRVAERERIARELHDTLLQSFQGVLMLFQSIADRIPPDSSLRNSIEDGLDYADAALAEGRERVQELRGSTERPDFAEALRSAAAATIMGEKPRLSMTVKGKPRPLVYVVFDELLQVSQEAVRNALKHANADTLEIVVDYRFWKVVLTVRDDGKGIPEAIVERASPAGHYGVLGMQERAVRIGARLRIYRRDSGGTEIVTAVPASIAYEDTGRNLFGCMRRRRSLCLR